MIVEMRTYQLKSGAVPKFLERFSEALPTREKHSKLAAFWYTEVGALNQVIHVWPYESFEARVAARAAAMKEPGWPPATRELTIEQKSEIYLPAPFSPKLEPRALGGIYEIRSYTLAPGAVPGMIDRWAEKIEERQKLSPLVAAWYSEVGGLNKWVHIWAYKDAAERQKIRGEAVARGIWPPGSPEGTLLKMENMLVVPAPFSPLK